MRKILTFLLFTLLCLGASNVFSEHEPHCNNGGHTEWGRNFNSSMFGGPKYTDYWYKVASDSDHPMYANTRTETSLTNVPVLLNSRATWKASAEVECRSNGYRGFYWVDAFIIVDGETKDFDWGASEDGYMLSFNRKFKDLAKAYHSESKTAQGFYPYPSITASDCYASGTINGQTYTDSDITGVSESHSDFIVDLLTVYKDACSIIPWDNDTEAETANFDGVTTTCLLADFSIRTLTPASGSNTYATAGSTHEASLTSSVPYDSVVWQVRTPSNTGNIVPTVETDTGDGTATDASMSYTFPTGVTGTYTIMAYVWYSDLSARGLSYDVTVTLSPGLRPMVQLTMQMVVKHTRWDL